uniref:Uncharacterized protein n=1 Tax=Strigamia maritima TaxID=126957 RepID=T1JF63_STRMM
MAAQKGKGKHSRNTSKSSIDNSEWEKESITDASSEGEKPLLKRGDFICSTGHNLHLKEDFEPNQTLLVGRKVRNKKQKPVDKKSNDSHSLKSFPSDLTLSSQASSTSPTLPAILKLKHLQTVPEEAETRHYPRSYYPYAPSPTLSDFDSPRTPSSTSSSKTATPTTTRKKMGLLGRLWTSEDPPQQPINKKLDFFDIAARSVNRNRNIVDTYEPYTYNESPKQLRKQYSTGSLPRSSHGRLLLPRESVVHPTGLFDEPLEDETTSYATVFDPRTGRQSLVRRDSIIHPNQDGVHEDRLTRRRNSIVRPLQTEPSISHVEEMDRRREESIKRHLLGRQTPVRSLGVSFAPTEFLPSPKYINGRFEVPWETQHKPGLFDAIRWKLTSTDRSRVPKDDVIEENFAYYETKF